MSDQPAVLKNILAWVSGTVVLISLVLGVLALNNKVQDWRDTRSAVKQLVAGGNAALEAGDFRLANNGYDQAMELDPASPELRDGQTRLALLWLRAMIGDIRQGESYGALAMTLLPHLYAGLEGKTDREQAIIWAHVGWAHHLERMDRTILNMRPGSVSRISRIYDRAQALDERVFYTPVFRGYLELHGRSDLSAASAAFQTGLELAEASHGASSAQFRWARNMQLTGVLMPMGRASGGLGFSNGGFERGLVLLRALNDARLAGESIPTASIVDEMFGLYRTHINSAGEFARIMSALPIAEHRDTFDWMLDSSAGESWLALDHNKPTLLLVKALLLEDADPAAALVLYREIYEFDRVNEDLAILIDEGIARISGEAPPRMIERLGRTYENDEVPVDGDIYAFHLDTLMNFDTEISASNSVLAFDYFADHGNLKSLADAQVLPDLRAVRDKLVNDYRAFNREVETHGYSSQYSLIPQIQLTNNLLKAYRMTASTMLGRGLINQALAELDDAEIVCEGWYPSWLFELRSRAYSRRNSAGDLDLAAASLQQFIEARVAYGGALDWGDVKTHADFAALRATGRYREIMRGR